MENSNLPNQSKKVLIIEDDQAIQKIYQTKLSQEGYQIIQAFDGQEGIEKAKTECPNLVILDLVLPKIDGFEVLKKIKKDKKTEKIPVIILSNLGQKEDLEKGLSLGADDYLIKAMHPITDVLMRVRKQLQQKKDEKKKTQVYNIAIKESIIDGPKLAKDFNFRGLFSCPKCDKTMVLQLIPQGGKKENRIFSARFVCLECKKF